jgi:isocitrate/isopropylmalate dehydrogenase
VVAGEAAPLRIAVLPGDGIGPEVVAQAIRVLKAVADRCAIPYQLEHFPQSAAHYRATGELMSPAELERIRSCHSLLFGAAGVPDLPGVMERTLILDLAVQLGLNIGIRPVRLHHARLCPLRNIEVGDIDMVIVRDQLEGELAIPGGHLDHAGISIGLIPYTVAGVDRVIDHGFAMARQRRKHVAVVAQSNALFAHRIWEQGMERVAAGYPDVEYELLYPDHAAMQFIAEPRRFDVVVTTLLLGGLYADLLAALVGGLGLVPSARINTTTGFGYFEGAHGSAPRHAGHDRASPLATIKSLAMLLQQCGYPEAGAAVDDAVHTALASGRIPDGTTRSAVGTAAQGDIVVGLVNEGVAAHR